ncbi:MAG: hypothetical protein D6736_18530 [Nitrospinota bacterium]|nr:MAG: hypothetical protein D6736_18530 [Nitrospinota bacterium]
MIRTFTLVFSQLVIGSLFFLPLLPIEKVRQGFYRLCASLFLLLTGLTVFALYRWFGWNAETGIFGGLFALLLLYNVTLWGNFPRARQRLLPLISAGGGVILLVHAFMYQPPQATLWEAIFIPLNFVFSALALGAVFIGLALGHWYLFVPALPLDYFRRLTLYLFLALVGQVLLIGTNLLYYGLWEGGIKVDLLFSGFLPIFLVRIFIGTLSSIVLAVLTWQTLKWKATQAATGIFFIALLTVIAGELVSRFLFLMTTLPL